MAGLNFSAAVKEQSSRFRNCIYYRGIHTASQDEKSQSCDFLDLNFSEDHNLGCPDFGTALGVAMSIETLPARHRAQFPSGKLGGNWLGLASAGVAFL